MAEARLNGGASASSSRSRVRGVRRSWLTEASRAVRWSMWRWIRSRMARKAVAGGADLAGPVRLEPRARLAPPEGLGRLGQPFDGADLIADEQDRDRHQQHGGHHQPQHEDMGLGRHGPLARGDDPQHALRLLHLDVDIGRIAGGREPEGLVQPRRPAPPPASGRPPRPGRAPAPRAGYRLGRKAIDSWTDRSARSAITARFCGVGSSR